MIPEKNPSPKIDKLPMSKIYEGVKGYIAGILSKFSRKELSSKL